MAADVRAIYKMGHFQDITAEVADTPEGKVITYTLQQRALISEIVIKGNKKISKGDIEGVLTFKTRQILNPEKVRADIERIRGLYHSKGYYNADITDQVEKEGRRTFGSPIILWKAIGFMSAKLLLAHFTDNSSHVFLGSHDDPGAASAFGG